MTTAPQQRRIIELTRKTASNHHHQRQQRASGRFRPAIIVVRVHATTAKVLNEMKVVSLCVCVHDDEMFNQIIQFYHRRRQ